MRSRDAFLLGLGVALRSFVDLRKCEAAARTTEVHTITPAACPVCDCAPALRVPAPSLAWGSCASAATMLDAGNRSGTDKVLRHGYHRFVQPHLEAACRLAEGFAAPPAVLEIGIDTGRSLRMWREVLPGWRVYGMDRGVEHSESGVVVFKGDQSSINDLHRVRDAITHTVPLIVDDGSHIPEHQLLSFNALFTPLLAAGGVYILEVIETSYWRSGGLYGYDTRYGLHHRKSVLEVFKAAVDAVNGEFLLDADVDAVAAATGGCAEEAEQAQRIAGGEAATYCHGIWPATLREITSIEFAHNVIIVTKRGLGDAGFVRGSGEYLHKAALLAEPPQHEVEEYVNKHAERLFPGHAVDVIPAPALLERYLDLLAGFVTGSLHPEAGRCRGWDACALDRLLPFDAELRRGGNDWPPFGLTMVGDLRVANVRMAISAVIRDGVPGDVVEMGVWRGGVCIFAKAMIDATGETVRRVHLFDAFASLAVYGAAAPFLMTAVESVRDSFERLGLLDERVIFHQGLFSETVPAFAAASNASIAVLRLDGNHYVSHADPLYLLYERVPIGGFVIFDDIRSHAEVKLAWQHFQEDQGFSEELVSMEPPDMHASWFRKRVAVSVDPSKRRPTPAHVAMPTRPLR